MKIQCLIADDEQPARDLLASYIGRMDDLELKGICSNAIDTFSFLQKESIDLLFLDIQMPKMTGLELIRSLRERPRIILTTAYREFAVDGFELDVLDYLVKPISFDRFLKSLAKFNQQEWLKQSVDPLMADDTFHKAYLYFKVNKDLVKIMLPDILYVESDKDYVRIVTRQQTILTYQRIGYLEEKLPENRFLRIHKSYIVAVDHIQSCTADTVCVDGKHLPIGRNYRQGFQKHLMKI
jgi:DNA-binding LytR/AlgR family response regulator